MKTLARILPLFGLLAPSLLAQSPTYSKEVSRILQAKCQICHRDGDVAPFALNNYDDAWTWALDIQRVLNANLMPPWKPVVGYGNFRDSYALTADEKQTILSWIDGGTPEGDPADLPDAPPVTRIFRPASRVMSRSLQKIGQLVCDTSNSSPSTQSFRSPTLRANK